MDNNIVNMFMEINEPFGAGLFANPERSRFYRLCAGHAYYIKGLGLKPYNGGSFYPDTAINKFDYAIVPHMQAAYDVDFLKLKNKSNDCAEIMHKEADLFKNPYNVHCVAGWSFTHSMPNYTRVAAEGLNSYRERIMLKKDKDFREGLLLLLDAIECYKDKCVEYLIQENAKPELIAALKRVPFEPAKDIYEAMVGRIFMYLLDYGDNFGRIDYDLAPYYHGENIEEYLREMFCIIDKNDGFSSAIGPDYNPITMQCIRAIKGFRRPSLELRVTANMPDELWEAAAESLIEGTANPCLYNEIGYYESFKKIFPNIPYDDYLLWCGAGCTETTIAGMSNIGSLDAGMNLLHIFSDCMRNHMKDCTCFSDFYNKYMELYLEAWMETIQLLEQSHKLRAKYRPNPLRTLYTDDCIDNETDFNNGGARYTWSIINFAGIVNVVDSMLAVKELVFEKQKYDFETFITLLDGQDERILEECRNCPCFGLNNGIADKFARKFTDDLFDVAEKDKSYLGGKFIPASIQFLGYTGAGENIPATPDGRESGEPLADSLAAIHGKDTEGVTTMLKSVASIDQSRMLGTPVLNLKLSKNYFSGRFKGLVLAYFDMGGMQLQINCVSKDDLLNAQKTPDKYGHLIVRVGGYSEYFTRLSLELQNSVIQRTEFN